VNGKITITELARDLGVSAKTILRWEKAGKIRKARRDWRGWRVYAPEDINELKEFFEAVY
jgi:excisionase family DNA binding protein